MQRLQNSKRCDRVLLTDGFRTCVTVQIIAFLLSYKTSRSKSMAAAEFALQSGQSLRPKQRVRRRACEECLQNGSWYN